MTGILGITIKIYSLLLRLYPSSFRSEFEEQMLMDFSDMAVDARQKGFYSLLMFCVHELFEFPINLLQAYLRQGGMSRILRSQPLSLGLRGAIGFGAVYALTFPLSRFVYSQLSFIDSFVTRLQVYYYDQFHIEQTFEWISQIPQVLSSLLMSLVLGVLFAVLFAKHSQYPRYILIGILGWLLQSVVGSALSFNFWVFLKEVQFTYFSYMVAACSGAIWGLIFVVAKSENRHAVRWLVISVFAYPLFSYLWVKGLFNLFVFQTPWRFIGLTIMVVILITSLFLIAIKLNAKRKFPWVIVAAVSGYLLTRPLVYLIGRLIYPPMVAAGTALDSLSITISNVIYGVLFGAFLGLILGLQDKSDSRRAMA